MVLIATRFKYRNSALLPFLLFIARSLRRTSRFIPLVRQLFCVPSAHLSYTQQPRFIALWLSSLPRRVRKGLKRLLLYKQFLIPDNPTWPQ